MINISISSIILVTISLFLLLSIIQIVLLMIYKKIYSNSRDEYIINISVLEHIIDDYYNMILEKDVQRVRKKYNLDPESKVNSIIAFEKQVNELITKSSVDIIKMLTPRIRKCLGKRFSDNSLALIIINRIKQNAF